MTLGHDNGLSAHNITDLAAQTAPGEGLGHADRLPADAKRGKRIDWVKRRRGSAPLRFGQKKTLAGGACEGFCLVRWWSDVGD